MNKNINEDRVKRELNLCTDLINIFIDYVYSLDKYFKSDANKEKNYFLYNEYKFFNRNIKNSIRRNGFDLK
uniref:Uncharacterized protein n=1 Tax=Dulem virus 59 TaxID=3145770 RepID=A0AAU8B772_9VIRU